MQLQKEINSINLNKDVTTNNNQETDVITKSRYLFRNSEKHLRNSHVSFSRTKVIVLNTLK